MGLDRVAREFACAVTAGAVEEKQANAMNIGLDVPAVSAAVVSLCYLSAAMPDDVV